MPIRTTPRPDTTGTATTTAIHILITTIRPSTIRMASTATTRPRFSITRTTSPGPCPEAAGRSTERRAAAVAPDRGPTAAAGADPLHAGRTITDPDRPPPRIPLLMTVRRAT